MDVYGIFNCIFQQTNQEHGRSLKNDDMILLLVPLVFELIPSKIHHRYILWTKLAGLLVKFLYQH